MNSYVCSVYDFHPKGPQFNQADLDNCLRKVEEIDFHATKDVGGIKFTPLYVACNCFESIWLFRWVWCRAIQQEVLSMPEKKSCYKKNDSESEPCLPSQIQLWKRTVAFSQTKKTWNSFSVEIFYYSFSLTWRLVLDTWGMLGTCSVHANTWLRLQAWRFCTLVIIAEKKIGFSPLLKFRRPNLTLW